MEEQTTQQESQVMRFKRSHVYGALIPLTFVVGLATGYLFWGRDSQIPPAAAQEPTAVSPAVSQGSQSAPRFEVPTEDDPALGPEDAPIVIVEFSDFNCGYCRKWHEETFEPLMAKYPDKIRFVYRDFPITSQESFYAAQAAECAAEQDMFWPFHDALFSAAYPLGQEAYENYANELGMDAGALLECLDSGKYEEEVQADARFVANLGASGTPTFFVNGIPLVGAQPLSRFSQIIDQELDQ